MCPLDNLRTLMKGQGVYIEDKDRDVLQNIYDTGGQFAKVNVDVEPGCMQLSDSGGIVVIIESHQNKHHDPQLPEL